MEMKDIVETALKLELSPEDRLKWINEKDKEAREARAEKRREEADREAAKQRHEKEMHDKIEEAKEKQRIYDDKIRQQSELAKQKEEARLEKEEIRKQNEEARREKERLHEIAMTANREKFSKEDEEEKIRHRKFETDEREKDRLLQLQIEKDKNTAMLAAKQLELDSKAELETQRRDDRKDLPKHKKYQHVIKAFTKDDNFPAWLKNMERCLKEDDIPIEDWAFILKKSLSGEPQRLIENVGEQYIGNYEYLREKLLHHFKCDSEGYRTLFRNMGPKSNQTFFDYLTEVESTLDSWVNVEGVNKSYEGFRQMIVKDKILSSIPTAMAKFLKEQRTTTVTDLEEKGTAYFNANRDVFALCSQPELEIGAAANWSKDKHPKQQNKRWKTSRSKEKGVSTYPKESKCKYCETRHKSTSLCDSSPEGKAYLKKHIKYAAERRKQCALEGKCFCCKLRGHLATSCGCKRRSSYANAIDTMPEPTQKLTTKYMRQYMHELGLDSDTEDEIISLSSEEDEWEANAVNIHYRDQYHRCETCKAFHEYGTLSCGHMIPYVDVPANAAKVTEGKLKVYPGKVNGIQVETLRDTGATLIGVQKDYVADNDYTGEHVICRTFGGTKESYPLAWIEIETPFISKRVVAAVLENPCASLILGNVKGIKECSDQEIQDWTEGNMLTLCNAVTRQQSKQHDDLQQKMALDIITPNIEGMNKDDRSTREKFIQTQQTDESLRKCFEMIDTQEKTGKDSKWKFILKKGILTRMYTKSDETLSQIVLPSGYRETALDIAHNNPFAGHLGAAKTKDRLLYQFYWPGFTRTIKTWCKSCKVCQHMAPKGKHPKAFVQSTDLSTRPFQKVAVDIVGPLNTVSSKGNRFILTMIDLCTRWPEALPLKYITSEAITESFFHLFSRIGFPEVILSDRGTQFISAATQAVSKMLGIKQVFTAPYNPAANGVCENFNGTLKKMLAKVTDEHPTDWDTLLPAVLFAYREVPQKSTGFSPFELVYGANPRGPLTIYKELLIGKLEDEENRTNAELVTNLRHKIITSCDQAKEALRESAIQHRYYANQKAKKIELNPKDKVLLLLPDNADKLAISWQGPFEITRKISDVDYEVQIKNKLKIYHINMLKPFTSKEVEDEAIAVENSDTRTQQRQEASSLITEKDVDNLPNDIEVVEINSDATWKDCILSSQIPTQYRQQFINLMKEFAPIFSNQPGHTNLIQHHIKVITETPVKLKPYPIPVHYQSQVEKEINELEKLGIIQRSTSQYSSPIVIIKKKDDTLRICIDYRQLNSITIPDAEPIPNVDDLMVTLAHSKIFSKLDMTKGYYQIPMSIQSRYLTAFAAPQGLFEWVYMPFGLVNAPATFVRMTRLLLKGVQNVTTYMDDMCVNTDDYEEHIKTLRKVFKRIQDAQLTIKPSKMDIGFTEISFLGHNVTQGIIRTDDKIVSKILNLEIPTTKKQVRSILGLMNYYAKFIPEFSDKTAIFSSLLSNSAPTKIKWNNELQEAFQHLKQLFSEKPILKIPNYKLPFVLQTDASGIAIAGCLLQAYEDILHPVLYISRKLNAAEKNYSTIEKEALAIIFSILKLKKFLLGRKFLILTDSKPLAILTSKLPKNSRLTRWSLILQDYRFEVQHIKGTQNCLPDILSRLGK